MRASLFEWSLGKHQDAPVRDRVVADSGVSGPWGNVRRAGKFNAYSRKKTRARLFHARV
jgi:hypothetical protein